ncbi:MAG: hypothetical protein AAFR76_13560 [Planctomycetota bacterium]
MIRGTCRPGSAALAVSLASATRKRVMQLDVLLTTGDEDDGGGKVLTFRTGRVITDNGDWLILFSTITSGYTSGVDVNGDPAHVGQNVIVISPLNSQPGWKHAWVVLSMSTSLETFDVPDNVNIVSILSVQIVTVRVTGILNIDRLNPSTAAAALIIDG